MHLQLYSNAERGAAAGGGGESGEEGGRKAGGLLCLLRAVSCPQLWVLKPRAGLEAQVCCLLEAATGALSRKEHSPPLPNCSDHCKNSPRGGTRQKSLVAPPAPPALIPALLPGSRSTFPWGCYRSLSHSCARAGGGG